MANPSERTTTLTDAQIKALPTTPITIVPALGSGFACVPIYFILKGNFTAGAYTNIKNSAFAYMRNTGAGNTLMSGYLGNDPTLTPVMTRLSDFFGAAAYSVLPLIVPLFQFDPTSSGWTDTALQWAQSDINNTNVQLFWNNGGNGNLTGGNAANTLVVETHYLQVAV